MTSTARPGPVALSQETLHDLPEDVDIPTYDRADLSPGIVHLGVGGFHRAHQAMYVDRLLDQRDDVAHWGICGVGVLEADETMAEAMQAQDCLYTLVLTHPDGTWEPRVVGSLARYLHAPRSTEELLELMTSSSTRIVSLTVTEGGYNIDATSGEFQSDADAVQTDLEPDAVPATSFGLVVEALRRRREAGTPPFTVMSCDNIEGNGHVARHAFTAFARLRDDELADWIEREVSFPSSMVDRITPETTDEMREEVASRLGVDDRWPVVCEPFVQWVLEDDFPQGRPPFEDVGVQLVDDVRPYELMKLRLLNAGHQALGYLGYLSGHRMAHEAAGDPLVAAFVRAYMDEEGTPTLEPVPGIDLDDYKDTLLERFANPGVGDTLARLCAASSDRIPKWVLPVVRSNLESDGPVRLAAAIVAGWARYAEGTDEDGEPIEVVDALSDSVVPAAQAARSDGPAAFLEQRDIFGDLADDERFVEAFGWALESLQTDGAQATLEKLVGDEAADR